VVTGISDAQFELLKWYFIEVDDDTGYDAATEVIARCMKTVAPGTRVAGGDGASLPVITVRDLLDDLRTVIDGPERVKLRDAAGLLRKVDQLYPRYRQMTATQLREDLAAEGVKTVNASGTLYLDPAELRSALTGRGE
jgi:S-DNA-T family DNA segregation ATPase FtsK/SpoIIIE